MLRFSSESLRLAFAAYLGGDLPEPVLGAVITTVPPVSYTSAGEPGMIAQDDNYLYVYTGDGDTIHKWPRIPLAHGWT